MAGKVLEEVSEEKDLKFKNLKLHSDTAAVVNKTSILLGLIKKCFTTLCTDAFTNLYKSIFCPCVQYSKLIWDPFYIIDCNKNRKQIAKRNVLY